KARTPVVPSYAANLANALAAWRHELAYIPKMRGLSPVPTPCEIKLSRAIQIAERALDVAEKLAKAIATGRSGPLHDDGVLDWMVKSVPDVKERLLKQAQAQARRRATWNSADNRRAINYAARDRRIHDAKAARKKLKEIASDEELSISQVSRILRRPRP